MVKLIKNQKKENKTRYQLHVEKWKDCTKCDYHKHRKKVVFMKGQIPCDILFVGEAPGVTEDIFGKPFHGPAGNLLHEIINDALKLVDAKENEFRLAYTNIVACIPKINKYEKEKEPYPECVKECAPRLQQQIEMANPKVIMCVGRTAKDYLKTGYFNCKERYKISPWVELCSMFHPSYLLHKPNNDRKRLEKSCSLNVQGALIAVREFREAAKEAKGEILEFLGKVNTS